MNDIMIKLDESTDRYTVMVDGRIAYECLSADELQEVLKELEHDKATNRSI